MGAMNECFKNTPDVVQPLTDKQWTDNPVRKLHMLSSIEATVVDHGLMWRTSCAAAVLQLVASDGVLGCLEKENEEGE
jgi:hypothetical protein